MHRYHRAPLTAMLAPLLTVAPALVALMTALGLAQFAPIVRAATRPPPAPVPKPLATLMKPALYPADYPVARTMRFARPIAFGDWAWNETRGPLTGAVLVTVDIESQTMSVFRGGYQIGATRIIYGDDDKPTPTGVFPILEKDEKHRSNLFVNAPMPYMLRMTGDGISIHGAEKVEPIYATNGCIGIPNGFARRLFEVVVPGDRIVVTKAAQTRAGVVIRTGGRATET